MTTNLRYVLAGLALSVVTLTVATVRQADTDHSSVSASPLEGPYVALGDSYTSGPKIPGQTGKPAGCDRSDRNYPALVAAQLHIKQSDFRDMSCSGATTADLASPQSTKKGTNPAQMSALSSRTRLVTIGIGGNDIDFSSIITRCVAMGTAYNVLSHTKDDISENGPCEKLSHRDDADSTQQQIVTLGTRLSGVLREVSRRAPKAHIYVIGYPAILPSGSISCGHQLPLALGDIAYLRDKEKQLNNNLRKQAGVAGATYVDTYTASQGHGACSAENTRWIEPLIPRSPAAAVHPNARGQQGMADAVLRAMAVSQ